MGGSLCVGLNCTSHDAKKTKMTKEYENNVKLKDENNKN
jgi:hypothetical protein